MMQFQPAVKKQLKARVAIDGPSGAGKTFTALVLATSLAGDKGKIAVIDTERGSAKLYADKFKFDVLELDQFSPAVYTQAIQAAEQAGYSVIVIDSLTHAWEGEGGALDLVDKAATRQQGNTYTAWKDVTPLHRRMVDAMLQSNAHIVATMRSKMEYVLEKNDKGYSVPRKVGMAPIQRQGMEYEFTLVGDMDVDHHFSVSKSRCDLLADKVWTKPTAKDFESFVKWLDSGDVVTQPKTEYKPSESKPEVTTEKPTITTPAPENMDKKFHYLDSKVVKLFANERGLETSDAVKALNELKSMGKIASTNMTWDEYVKLAKLQ